MSKKLLSTLIASLFVAGPALAQSDDTFRVQGSMSIGGIYVNEDATDAAKLQEYRDLGNGVLSNIFLQGRNRTTWVDAYGENFTRDDQYLSVRGGMYDVFKYGAYSNSLPHNFAFGARTPLAGSGGNLLVAAFPQTNPDNWNRFDLGYKRTDNGGYVEWQGLTPWYFRADGNQIKFDGTKVGSGANGTSPTQGYTDLAFPTQYTTDNFGVEGGYQTRTMTFALRWDYSKFSNDYETLGWSNPYFGNNVDTTWLPPGNEFNKFTATANIRSLPWNSVLSARYTWSQTESDTDLATAALNGTGATAFQPTYPSESTFHGKHENQSLQASWTANPAQGVDTRLYYFWSKLDNKSDLVEYGHAPTTPLPGGLGCGNIPNATGTANIAGNCDSENFSYDKQNVGFDAYWRFMRGHRIGFGWDYVDLDQERFDYNAMEWNKLFVEYRSTALDSLAFRLKYTYIDRESNFILGNAGASANDPNYLLRYTTAFDMQDMKGNWFKATLDWSPMPMFDVSFEGIWKDNDYQNVTYGRTSDKRQEYYLSASYGAPDTWRVTAFGDWEEVKYPSEHRYIGSVYSGAPPQQYGSCTAAVPNCYSPTNAPNAQAYNWSSSTKDQNWAVGIGLDLPVNPQWLIKASYMYFETDGSADFTSQNNFGSPINISTFDDTERTSFNLKAIYAFNKAWSFTAGYAYEKWEYSDISYDGYQFTIPYPAVTTNTSQSYLNGYNAFTNGEQNIFYGLVTFRF